MNTLGSAVVNVSIFQVTGHTRKSIVSIIPLFYLFNRGYYWANCSIYLSGDTVGLIVLFIKLGILVGCESVRILTCRTPIQFFNLLHCDSINRSTSKGLISKRLSPVLIYLVSSGWDCVVRYVQAERYFFVEKASSYYNISSSIRIGAQLESC